MNHSIKAALESDRTIDITTTRRKTGGIHRLEIWFHNLDGALYITGRPPKKRDWYANLVANQEFTFHLKNTLQADIPAQATPIKDNNARRAILAGILKNLEWEEQLEDWVEHSPLVEVKLETDS